MKTILAVQLLSITLGAAVAACDDARAQMPQARPAKYFGDEFAQAQRELASKPMAEMPQAF